MDAHELMETDKLLQAAQLLRLSEAGFARDQHGRITQQADPNGEKLDWYSLGLLDALRVARGYDRDRSRLLIYLILLVPICAASPVLVSPTVDHSPPQGAWRPGQYFAKIFSNDLVLQVVHMSGAPSPAPLQYFNDIYTVEFR